MKLFSLKKKFPVLLEAIFKVFHHFFHAFSFSAMHFHHCFLVGFILFIDCIILSHHVPLPWLLFCCFLSGTSFLCSCFASAMNLSKLFLLSGVFLPYTPFWHFAQPGFIKASVGARSSSLKVAGPPTEVRNGDLAHPFIWITQYSAKSTSL